MATFIKDLRAGDRDCMLASVVRAFAVEPSRTSIIAHPAAVGQTVFFL